MTELLTGVEAPSDAELISRVRGGDVAAYGDLFSRHVEAARRLGRQLVRGPDVDDLVSEAFAKTLIVLQGGGGPDVAFRAYLLTSVRRLHVDKLRAAKRVQPSEDMSAYDAGLPFEDPAVADFEHGAAAKAFGSLPERWQLVLWHLEVEGQKPADIAPLLGMTPNSVSALAYRAREGLRQAFLTMHLADSPTEQCRWVNEHLGAHVRSGLSRRDIAKVEEHLDGCRRCTAMYLELTEVNHDLAAIIAPLVLGTAATGYLTSAGVGATGVSALLGRARDLFGNGSSGGGSAAGGAGGGAGAGAASTAGGLVTVGGFVAAGVAVVTAAALVLGGGGEKEVLTEADRPLEVTTPVAPAPAEDRADPVVREADHDADESTVGSAGTTSAVTAPAAEVVPPPYVQDPGPGPELAPPPAGDPQPAEDTTSSKPDTTDPSSSDPDTTDPGTTDPGTADAGTTDPGTADPGPTDPGPEDPAPVDVEFGFEAGAPDPIPVGHGESTVHIALRLVGVEAGGTVSLTLEGGAGGSHAILSAPGCTLAGDSLSATCDVARGTTLLSVDVSVRTPGQGKGSTLVASFTDGSVTVPLK